MILAALALIGGAASAYQSIATVEGIAKVKDGDGILFGEVEVRLQGIAAPEDNSKNRHPNGPAATAELRRLAEGRTVICHLDGTTTGKGSRWRPVGRCAVAGLDLGGALVLGGYARDCPRYSGGDYAAHEATAKAAGRDLSRTYRLPPYCPVRKP